MRAASKTIGAHRIDVGDTRISAAISCKRNIEPPFQRELPGAGVWHGNCRVQSGLKHLVVQGLGVAVGEQLFVRRAHERTARHTAAARAEAGAAPSIGAQVAAIH